MEIATNSGVSHLFPADQRYKTKDVGCKSIDFSDVLLLPINPKFDLDDPQISSRTGRDRKERYDVMAAPKKRQHSDEENPPEKRQKKTIEIALKSKITEPVDAKAKPEQSIKVSQFIHEKSYTGPRIRLHETKTITEPDEMIENQSNSFKDLIAKAREKLQEKREIDHRNAYIANKRLIARLAINQVVATVAFDDHLKYHTELEQLGCDFIHDQVCCLEKFSFLSRSRDYVGESNSVLETKETSRSSEDSMGKKQKRSTTDKSMEYSDNKESAGSCSNQRKSKCQG